MLFGRYFNQEDEIGDYHQKIRNDNLLLLISALFRVDKYMIKHFQPLDKKSAINGIILVDTTAFTKVSGHDRFHKGKRE